MLCGVNVPCVGPGQYPSFLILISRPDVVGGRRLNLALVVLC